MMIVGMAALFLMTRWGIGTGPDSAHYIRAARQLAGESGNAGLPGLSEGSAQFAPLYSWLLAAGGVVGVDALDAARLLNVVLFGLNIFLVGFIIRRSTRHATWFWLAGSLMVLGAAPVLSTHVVAMSEPLFLFFGLLGLYLLAAYLDEARMSLLLGAAAATALAFLSRYAGAAWIIAGGGALLLWGPLPLWRRFRDALLFAAVSALPMAVWILKNGSTGREIVFHPVGTSHAWQAIYTASAWMLIPPFAPNVVRLLATAAIAIALAALIARRTARSKDVSSIVPVLALLVVAYGTFLVMSISFLDANTPLDDRILLPVFVAGVILLLCLLDWAWPRIAERRPAAYAVAIALLAFVGVHLLTGTRLMAGSYANGWGFSGREWEQSATLDQVRRLPGETVVYSNAPALVYLRTGRVAASLPTKVSLMKRQANPAFLTEVAETKDQLRRSCGVVVYFRGLGEQRSLPDEQELRSLLSLGVRFDARDGAILSTATCQQR
jgi:4-amino-4-deoxy-L-arabinose transferase-like glycosyltransferase